MAEYIKIDTLSDDRFYDIRLRKFGLGELAEISANAKMGNTDDMIKTLSKIIETDNINEICIGDLKNIIIWSRILTLDETNMFVGFKCSNSNCNYMNPNEEIDLNIFKKHKLDTSINEINELVLEDGTKVSIELEKIKHLDIQKKIKNQIKDASDKVVKLTSLVKFDGKLTNSIERYKFLASPDNSDIAQEIDYFITRKCFFGIYDIAFYKCPKCGEVSQIWLKFRHDSFSKLKYLRDS